jgi:hypothetical protein
MQFVTDTTLGHVDNVRVANYASLPVANVGAPPPTGEIEIFLSTTDGDVAVTDTTSGGASPSPTDEIKIVDLVFYNTKKLPFSRELLLYYF